MLAEYDPEFGNERKTYQRRILCVADTNCAARHLAAHIARVVPTQHVGLKVSNEFFSDWHEDDYQDVKQLMKRPFEKRIICCTVGTILQSDLNRQFLAFLGDTEYLICDEASQIWELPATMLLQRLPTLQRLTMFGDPNQLPPYVVLSEAKSPSILDTFVLTANQTAQYICDASPLPLLLAQLVTGDLIYLFKSYPVILVYEFMPILQCIYRIHTRRQYAAVQFGTHHRSWLKYC